MGDFYEMFFEDAERASQALDITLTKRGKKGAQQIPMAGVPHHAVDVYLERLIKQGITVAVCDQVETPAEKAKGQPVVRREVTRMYGARKGGVGLWGLDAADGSASFAFLHVMCK